MKDKICAILRQTWYETAKKNLPAADRLRFYEICLEYEFYGNVPDEDAPFSARLLFDMVRPDIDEDKAKTAARAERARTNGLNGGRPKITQVNTTDTNPVGFSETDKKLIQTQTHIQEQKQTHVTSSDDNEDTHIFFNVCLSFFERGCSAPVEEGRKFWGYYEGLGWRTKGGGEIIDRLALAKAWTLKDCSKILMRKRMGWAELLHRANPTEVCLIDDFVDMVRDASSEKVMIKFINQESALLFDTKYILAVRSLIPVKDSGQPYDVEYTILQTHLD